MPGNTAAAAPTGVLTGTTAPGGLGNLFADLTSLISHLSDATAAASGVDAATTPESGAATGDATTGGTTTGSTTSADGSTALDSASALSAALVQDLQSIASDVSGTGSIFANGNPDSLVSAGTVLGMPPAPPFGGLPSWDPSAPSVATSAAGTDGTAATTGAAAAPNPSDALLQQIGQAVAAYMQSIGGQSSALGASLPNLNV